ncbi:hypothetical protein HOA92_02850 [archaeon]|jgi:hypothetical protein|nr:hypothetical protein [archaeon]MBT6761954.1 hypothetical protein [archaeon]
MGKISIDTPLAEIQLRRYEKPQLTGRDLVRRVCLSLGLLQPGDSRDVIVDIMMVLLKARTKKEELHSEEIKNHVIDIRKSSQLPMLGIAASNIRRQLKRLKDLHLIESNANLYRISEFANLSELFDEKIEKFLLRSIVGRVKDYLKAVDTEFSSN